MDLILVELNALNLSPVLRVPIRNAEALVQRVAADPVHTEMALLEAMQAGRL